MKFQFHKGNSFALSTNILYLGVLGAGGRVLGVQGEPHRLF